MKYLIILIMILSAACTVNVKQNEKKYNYGTLVDFEEKDEYELLEKPVEKMSADEKVRYAKLIEQNLTDVDAEVAKRKAIKIQRVRKVDLINRVENTENLRTRDFLKLLPKIKIEQRPYETYDVNGNYSKKVENFIGFEIDISKMFDLFDTSSNRAGDKVKAKKKIRLIYLEIKKRYEIRAYLEDMVKKYEADLLSRDPDIQKEARQKIPEIQIRIKTIDIDIAKLEVEQEYSAIELEK